MTQYEAVRLPKDVGEEARKDFGDRLGDRFCMRNHPTEKRLGAWHRPPLPSMSCVMIDE